MMIPRQKKQLFFSNKVMKIASIGEVLKEQMKVLYTQTQLQFSATFLFLGRREVFNFYLTWDNTQLDIGGERQTRDIMCAAPTFVLTSALIIRKWWTRKLVGSVALMTLLNGVGRDDFEPSSI